MFRTDIATAEHTALAGDAPSADTAAWTLDYGDPERYAEMLPGQATAAFWQAHLYYQIAGLSLQAFDALHPDEAALCVHNADAARGWRTCLGEAARALPFAHMRAGGGH